MGHTAKANRAPMREKIEDIRVGAHRAESIIGGMIYLKYATVQIWWNEWGSETWTLANYLDDNYAWAKAESETNFNRMVERFNERGC